MRVETWAPLARSVEIEFDGGARRQLGRGEHGHWSIEVDFAQLQRGYRFVVDGGKPIPDPRSRWQPDGPHGASQPVDELGLRRCHQGGFRPAPLADAILYELHVGTFTPEGTYDAARAKLPHLVGLGVTHVELMPVATFPGRQGWGYDGVNWYAPHPAYGRPAQLADFVGVCHAHGLGVLLDVVYNHFGPDGNYAGQFGPFLTDRWRTPWGPAINYDGPHSDAVREFAIGNALMWLRDYGFDGLRLDAVHAIVDQGARHLLEEMAERVAGLGRELGREFLLIAESDLNDPRLVRPASQGGFGLAGHWCDDFHHALHVALTGEREGYYADFDGLASLAIALREGYVFQGQYSPARQRRHGRPPAGVRAEQLLVCSQNHDQVGNRARGERLSQLLPVEKLRAAAALTVLSPFTPLLFQGEEWGARTPFLYFTDHQDPALARAVSEGRRREFENFSWKGEVPDPQAASTYRSSQLDWEEPATPPHAGLLEWYRRLIALRKSRVARPGESPEVAFDAAENWITLHHAGQLVACNFAAEERQVPLPAGRWEVALAGAGSAGGRSEGASAPMGSADGMIPAGATLVLVRRN